MTVIHAAADLGAGGACVILLGVAAIVRMPVIHGAMGFLGERLMAALHDVAAALLGGIELEVGKRPSRSAWRTRT